MFKLQPNPTFVAPVAIPVPGAAAQEINVTFAHKGKSEIKAYLDLATTREDIDSLSEIVLGWDGVDADFTRDNLAVLLDAYPGAAMALLTSWVNELGKAVAKN